MKRYKKYIVIIMSVMMLVYSIFNNKIVYADNGDNVVYRESSTLPQLTWTYLPNAGFYTYYVDDASGIPTGGGYYFWKYGNDNKFAAIQQNKMFTYILNTGVGLTCSSERLSTLISAYFTSLSNVETGFLYDGQGNKLGIVLNDITGCVYEAYPTNTDISVPSSEINNVYNWYHYYITVEDPIVPDYINVATITNESAKNKIDVTDTRYDGYISALNASITGINLWFVNSGNFGVMKYGTGSTNYGFRNYDNSDCTMYGSSTNWTNFCNAYDLHSNGSVVSYTDLITNTSSSDLTVYLYDTVNTTVRKNYTQYIVSSNTYSSQSQNPSTQTFMLCKKNWVPVADGKALCVYKDNTVLTQVVNNTYAPQTFDSTTYNNFDTNSTSNISTNSSVINNSQETNNSIYTDASQSFSEYYSSQDSYNIDNSVVIENTTEIIYNYYGDDSGGGGGGGGGGSDDDDDDLIWTALLKAIADFFKKLGELIATVLTGIVTIFTSILEALAIITTNFSAITDFLGSIFSWLPTEIVTLMTLGLSMALFAAFITWFRK